MRRNYSIPSQMLLAVFSCSFFTGFTGFIFKDDVKENVDQFKQQVKNSTKPSATLDDMDPKKLGVYKAYTFKATENPFLVKDFVSRPGMDLSDDDLGNCTDETCGDGPPEAHMKFFLENYNIDQLAMIGTMTDKKRGRVALIQTPDSGVVYAANGEYIGRNNGLILSVNQDRMIIREKYRSPKGWQDRMARLPLLKK